VTALSPAAEAVGSATGALSWPRQPTGEDEVYVLEHRGHPAATVLGLASRLWAQPPDRAGGPWSAPCPPHWQDLPAVTVGTLALSMRRAWLGDLVRTETICADPSCGQPVDIEFSITAYLDYHRPRKARWTAPASAPGWHVLTGTDVQFRVPMISDLLAALQSPDPEALLAGRCIRPDRVPAAISRRIDRALTALAPSQTNQVTGTCPECGQPLSLTFEPVSYALTELRAAAASVYEQVSLVAAAFGWPEREILSMPRRRRSIYSELVQHPSGAPT
jgi:hypothetical protein